MPTATRPLTALLILTDPNGGNPLPLVSVRDQSAALILFRALNKGEEWERLDIIQDEATRQTVKEGVESGSFTLSVYTLHPEGAVTRDASEGHSPKLGNRTIKTFLKMF